MKFKNIILSFLLIVSSLFLVGMKGVKAYEFPTFDYYVIVDSQALGQVTIHIPSNQIDLLQIQETSNDVINISSGSVYGYINHGNNEYRVTFPTFATPTYRLNSNSYTNSDLNINYIVDTNIQHLKDDSLKTVGDYIFEYATDTNMFVLTFFIFFVGVLLWLKH